MLTIGEEAPDNAVSAAASLKASMTANCFCSGGKRPTFT